MMRLSRKQKIVRNVFLCAVSGVLLYILLDSPAYTVAGMCRRVQRDYLLPTMEPVYVEQTDHVYNGWMFKTRFTFVIAKAGEEYVSFRYQTHLLHSERDTFRDVVIQKEALCTARGGSLYAASERLKDAANATAVVYADPPSYTMAAHWPEGGRYLLEGTRVAEQVFAFPFASMGLTTAVSYRDAPDTVPVMVTLYDSGGMVLDTLSLEVGTYELTSAW